MGGQKRGNEDDETVYTCRRCPGTFFNEEEKEEHREYHRAQRRGRSQTIEEKRSESKKQRRTRQTSPVPSATTLFKQTPGQSNQAERLESAKQIHWKKEKGLKIRRFHSG